MRCHSWDVLNKKRAHQNSRASKAGSPGQTSPGQSGQTFRPASEKTYLIFFKPYGVLTQFTTPANSTKQTLNEFGFPPNVYPIGRLDYDSEGLLLLSDDGHLNHKLLTPQHGHSRTYLAQVENIPSSLQLQQLRAGIKLDGSLTAAAAVELLAGTPQLPERPVPIRFRKAIPTSWLQLTLFEGRNRQVRRMTASVGCPTLRLVRVAIGALDLFSLALNPGEWLPLKPERLLLAFKPQNLSVPLE